MSMQTRSLARTRASAAVSAIAQ